MLTAAVVADELENSQALAVADDGLSIDRTRAHRQRRDGCRNQRKAVGKVVTVPANQSNLGAITASQYSKAVVLDLMNPVGASRRSFAQAGADMARYYRKKDGGYAGETTAWMELKREGSADRVYFVRQESEARGCRSRAVPLLAVPRQLVPPEALEPIRR